MSLATRTFTIQAVISLVLIASALFVVLSNKYAQDEQHWAFATIAAVVAYWLKR